MDQTAQDALMDAYVSLNRALDRMMLPRGPAARIARIEAIIAERNDLEVERDRLREALEEIARLTQDAWARGRAQRALAAPEGDHAG